MIDEHGFDLKGAITRVINRERSEQDLIDNLRREREATARALFTACQTFRAEYNQKSTISRGEGETVVIRASGGSSMIIQPLDSGDFSIRIFAPGQKPEGFAAPKATAYPNSEMQERVASFILRSE